MSLRPTHEEVSRLLHYEEATGSLYWKMAAANRINVGDPAGSMNSDGYIQVQINGKKYKAHHLVWLLAKGYWPEEIDHADLDRANNRIGNLREATRPQNAANTGTSKNNTSGFKGVTFDKRRGRWVARLWVERQLHYLGSFERGEDAAAAYEVAAIRLLGDFARPVITQNRGQL